MPSRRHFLQEADLTAKSGTPIHTTGSSSVKLAGSKGFQGMHSAISQLNAIESGNAHRQRNRDRVAVRVSRNNEISYMGSKGLPTGPYLHYEVRLGGGNLDYPMEFINAIHNVFKQEQT